MIEHGQEVISISVECGGQSASFERMSYSVYMLDGETYIASEHANAANVEEYTTALGLKPRKAIYCII